MKKLVSLFLIRKEERIAALFFTLLLVALNALVIAKYAHLFMPLTKYYWPLFIHNFHISGFDPIPYSVLSYWEPGYNVYRHPLLWLFYYPLYLLNQGLMWLTGVNCAIFIMPVVQITCALYTLLFFYRLFTDVLELAKKDAWLLSFMLFSFSHILISAIVPDHFVNSLFCLVLLLYVSGLKMKQKKLFNKLETLVLFTLTAGITLSNGLKVFIASLFTSGKKFLQLKYFLLAVLFPSLLIWGFCKWQYATIVYPVEMAKKKAKAEKAKKDRAKKMLMLAQTAKDKMTEDTLKAPTKKVQKAKKKEVVVPIYPRSFLRWTDISTPRLATIIENLFGEGIQLHSDYVLGDVLISRPLIVPYKYLFNYVVEGLLIALFALGLWCGRRNRLLQIAVCFGLLDMTLHLGLGFGIREIYIMTPHWAYVIPLSIAFLLQKTTAIYKNVLRGVVLLLTLFLYVWNICLTANYLLH